MTSINSIKPNKNNTFNTINLMLDYQSTMIVIVCRSKMVRCVKPTGIPDIDRGSKYEETIDDSLDSLDKGVRV
jgi:hypothetical protein